MAVWKAEKTLAAIDAAMCNDGGNAYRRNLGLVLPHMGDAYRDTEDDRRSHLGASVIGGECERAVFYGFRWASKKGVRGKKGEPKAKAESRMRRLWNRGHIEEARFIALLLSAGIQVYQQDANGNQFRIINLGGHFSGSGDGVGLCIPDLPYGVPALLEMKTHSDDSFESLKEKGVRLSKPVHYVQMCEYMAHMGLLYALYLAVNKNTDELWAEIVVADNATAQTFMDRAQRVVFGSLPQRIRGGNPGFYVCKYMCDHTDVCYSTVKPERSCRTCAMVYFAPDGKVLCLAELNNTGGVALTKEQQIQGCAVYTLDKKLQP